MSAAPQVLLAELAHSGRRLVSLAQLVPGGAAVPSCPGWTVTELVRHVNRVHQRALHALAGGSPGAFAPTEPPESNLLEVVATDLGRLVDRLAAGKPGGAPTPDTTGLWTRRMAHETAIHRVDLELAADTGMLSFDADFAADGIEELLERAPMWCDRAGITGAAAITLLPLDVNRSWTVCLSPDAVQVVTPAQNSATLTVAGIASELYRWVWNRAGQDEVSMEGSLGLAELWRRSFALAGEEPGEGA